MKNLTIPFILLMVITTACNPTFYVPNTQNVPIIDERGKTNLNASGNFNQFEFQGAYGISSKYAIQANFAFYTPRDLDNGNGGSGKLYEGGFGYYKPVWGKFVFETYFLFGLGRVENHFQDSTANPNSYGKLKANLNRYTIQPSLSFKHEYYTISLSSRFSGLNYGNIKGDLVFEGVDQQVYLKANQFNFLIEPALTVRVGLERIKFQLQVMHSFNISNKLFKQDDQLISVGLNFNF